MRNIRIDRARLWDSLMAMAQIGATAKGGSKRLAPSDLDREGRDLFVRWCREVSAHNEVESATPEDLAAGCNVLLRAMLERAAAG